MHSDATLSLMLALAGTIRLEVYKQQMGQLLSVVSLLQFRPSRSKQAERANASSPRGLQKAVGQDVGSEIAARLVCLRLEPVIRLASGKGGGEERTDLLLGESGKVYVARRHTDRRVPNCSAESQATRG
jgi:hypothetical protein